MILKQRKKIYNLLTNIKIFVGKLFFLSFIFTLFNIIFVPQSFAAGGQPSFSGSATQLANNYVNGFMSQSSLFSPELSNLLNTISSEISKFNMLGYSIANAVTTYGLQLLIMIFAVLLVWGSLKSTLIGTDSLADLFKEIIFLSMVTSIFVFSLYNYVYFMQLIETSFPFIAKTLATGITNGSSNPTGALIQYITSVDLGWLSTILKDISIMYSNVHGIIQLIGFLIFSAVLVYIGMLVFSIFVISVITYFVSQVLFVVIVSVGPFMIPFAIWRKTYYLFEGWLKFIIVAGLYQVIIFLIYTIIVGVMTYTQTCVDNTMNGFYLNLNEATNAISILWIAIGLMSFIPAIAGELVTGIPRTIDGYDTANIGGMIGFGNIKKGAEKVLNTFKGKSNNTKWTPTGSSHTFLNPHSNLNNNGHTSKAELLAKLRNTYQDGRNVERLTEGTTTASEAAGGEAVLEGGVLAEGAAGAVTTAEGVGLAAEGAGIVAGAAEAGAEAAIVGAQFIPGVDVAVDAAIVTGVVAYEGYELYEDMESGSGNDDSYESYANSFDNHNGKLNDAQDHAERESEERRKKEIEEEAKKARDAEKGGEIEIPFK